MVPEIDGDKGLLLNFRGAPLETVLNYLSQAAGFIIIPAPGLDVRGRVDVWSQQPVSKDEAVDLLNTILRKNGYAAIRDGRKIDIKTLEDAKKSNIPVKSGSDPESIPNNDEVVTQIIPVKYANALQMTKDLLPLLPSFATMTANESGNALVITDTQSDIRRMAQIVKALDTSISGISTIKVFPLRYADAKDLAAELKELFPAQTGNNQNNNGRGGFGRMGGGFPGMPGMPGADPNAGTGQSEARKAATRVVAVADERTNSLVVSASDDIMPYIEGLVKEIDTNAENITELRVFQLSYADPQEMADLLSNVFPDESKSSTGNRSTLQFGRGGGRAGGMMAAMMGGGNNAQTTGTSTRARQKGKVTAVADARTASVIVSAASDLMPQIAEMIAQLDANPAKKQKVFVYSLENADVDNVQQVLQDMFQSQNSRNTSNNRNNNPLTTRQQNQGYGNSSSSSGFGGSSSGGGGGTRRLGN
jgi:general secretion pathway protein D